MFDIVGDIHGHAPALKRLLLKMGYQPFNGSWTYPGRRLIFCGDLIDRGPQIAETLRIVRGIVDAGDGHCILGNHEWNALALHTEQPDGSPCRPRTPRTENQFAATRQQLSVAELRFALDWFRTLPFAMETSAVCVVHACFHRRLLAVMTEAQEHGLITTDLIREGSRHGTLLHQAVETVLKGPELALPEGRTVADKEGNARRRVRRRWYVGSNDRPLSDNVLPTAAELSDLPAPQADSETIWPADAPVVAFGHYWLPPDEIGPLADNVACLDYSVARGGRLAALRLPESSASGLTSLTAEMFVSVPADETGCP